MHYVLVISGKGGTGKTVVSVNLAKEIASKKGSVVLIDADLSNPNAAELLAVMDQIQVTAESFTPIELKKEWGILEFFSMATISGSKPVSMDASEYAQILHDVLKHSKWKSEITIIDMPAGIHNEFLELLTNFGENLLGSVIVLQPAHVEAAKKLLQLHKTEGVPVLGVIQNMSMFICEHGGEYPIFGNVDLDALCKEFEVPPLGSIPLSMEVRKGIKEGNPFLPDNLKEPIVKGAEEILKAKPVGSTFVERLKERVKQFGRDAMLEILELTIEISNTEVKLPEIQKAYGFPGGRTIELDVTDETLRKVKIQIFFRVENGVLKVVKNPAKIDDEIRVWERALVWCFLGVRSDTKARFDLMDAWVGGKVKFFSEGGTPRALLFVRNVWADVKNAPSFAKLKPILEKMS